MAFSTSKANNIIKFLMVLTASGLIVLGVLKYVFTKPMAVLTGIWTLYWIIFGTIILLVELGIKIIKDLFGFLDSYCGKGMFVIFCGTLLISSFSDPSTVHESIIGVLIMFIGVCIICVGYGAIPQASFPPPQQQ